MGERIVRVNLNGQWLFREQQLEQQMRVWGFRIGALKPKLPDRDTPRRNIRPRQEVGAPPGLAHHPRAGMFNRHVRTARAAVLPAAGESLWLSRPLLPSRRLQSSIS